MRPDSAGAAIEAGRRRIRRVLRNRRQAPHHAPKRAKNGAAGRFGSRNNKAAMPRKQRFLCALRQFFGFSVESLINL